MDNLTLTYLMYDLSSYSILQVPCSLSVFHDTVFPLKDLLMAGENMPKDLAFDIDGWRSAALLTPQAATDNDLVEFCVGKNIHVHFPARYYPQYQPNKWTGRVHRPIYHRSKNDKVVSVKIQVTNFNGPERKLALCDQHYKTHPLMFTLPITANGLDPSLRDALNFTYPSTITLYPSTITLASLS